METDKQTMQMIAKSALNDISNQDEGRTGFNWLKKQSHKQKKIKNLIKLPKLGGSFSKRYQDKIQHSPLTIHNKKQTSKSRMGQLMNVVQRSTRNLPNYYINKKLAEQINSIHRQSSQNNSVFTKGDERLFQKRKCRTQQKQEITQENYQNALQMITKRKFSIQHQEHHKRNWSLHVRNALMSINKGKQNLKQIQQIKELFQDKRNKCRKLSKQGYLIVKNETISLLKNGQNDKQPDSNSDLEVQSYSRLKPKDRYSIVSKSSMSHHKSTELNGMLHCKNFLANAHRILKLNQSHQA